MPDAGESRNRRHALEARWLALTRVDLPAVAAARGWPIGHDHCFQRVLLDHAFGGKWSDAHRGRPAYRTIPLDRLETAVTLAEAVLAGTEALAGLNDRSLAWRGVRPLRR